MKVSSRRAVARLRCADDIDLFRRWSAVALTAFQLFLWVSAAFTLAGAGLDPQQTTVLGLLVAATAATHLVVVLRDSWSSDGVRPTGALSVAFVLLPVVLAVSAPGQDRFDYWVLLPCAAIAFVAREHHQRTLVVLTGTLLVLTTRVLLAGSTPTPEVVSAWFWGYVSMAVLALVHVLRDRAADLLTSARRSRTAARDQAIEVERDRFANDLHDIQGHHLQAIAVQAELVAALVDRDGREARSLALQVSAQARHALQETRALVRAFRQVSLVTELGSCRATLQGAHRRLVVVVDGQQVPDAADGAAAGWPRRVVAFAMDLDPVGSRLLGLLVRETTTNFLRHSPHSRLEILLDRDEDGCRATIRDDEVPGEVDQVVRLDELVQADQVVRTDEAGVDPVPGPSGSGPGTGLTALAERFCAAGGSLIHGPVGAGYEVSAVLPVRAPLAVAE